MGCVMSLIATTRRGVTGVALPIESEHTSL